jgi:hypothetical protein
MRRQIIYDLRAIAKERPLVQKRIDFKINKIKFSDKVNAVTA